MKTAEEFFKSAEYPMPRSVDDKIYNYRDLIFFANHYHANEIKTHKELTERLKEALEPLLKAAEGLSFGTDWNNGTHAQEYRHKLLLAISPAKEALTAYKEAKQGRGD